jgi:hypothetical protein
MPVITAISPNQSDVLTVLKAFLTDVLGAFNPVPEIDVAQANRAAEPAVTNFVIMTPIRQERMGTNYDVTLDAKFTGSISGTVLTVSAIAIGAIQIGALLFSPSVTTGTVITAQTSGTPGGAGNYTVSISQNVSSGIMSAGVKTLAQGSIFTIQLDFHSGGSDFASEMMAMTVSTALRDEYGTAFFAALPPPQNIVSPLYADDPRQVPFVNDQAQYEWRWILELRLYIDQTITVPALYDDSVSTTLVLVP